MTRRAQTGALGMLLWAAALALPARAAPQVQNGGFEADSYTVSPGYARQNGDQITGWTFAGGAGVNPVWPDGARKAGPEAPFLDNGRVPQGRQVAFIQGPGALRQQLAGLRPDRRYRVLYRENARVQRRGSEWPRLRLLLGDQVLVSAHEVTPVAAAEQMDVPFYRVESAWFTPPAAGTFELRFETVQKTGTTTVLLDDIRLEEALVP